MYKDFKDMPVWKKAMLIAEKIFHMTEELPKKEDYGFTSQIRKSALSIAGNIAEGYGRYHTLDKINYYYYSRGSDTETQNHVEYGFRVGYFSEEDSNELNILLKDVYGELNKIIATLRNTGK